jgi:pSer/pThr/pTyr-binding forkhead associated (FHA) protein
VNLAGRHPNADIFLDDVTVSRRHVEILRTSAGFELRDLGSMNGTYLNGEVVEQAKLNDGDELRIGKFRLTFFMGGKH